MFGSFYFFLKRCCFHEKFTFSVFNLVDVLALQFVNGFAIVLTVLEINV